MIEDAGAESQTHSEQLQQIKDIENSLRSKIERVK